MEIKENKAIESMRAAQKINDEVYRAVIRYIKPSLTDKQVANEIKRLILKFGGGKELAFPTIVCSGVRTSLFHGPTSGAKKIKVGDPIYVDFGCKINGYCSDMTRTLFVGKPDDRMAEIYKHVKYTQELQIEMIKHGVSVAKIDQAGRDYLKEHNLEQYFIHTTGHGVGKKIHENPKIYYKSKAKLKAGQIITIEPGVYIPKFGGVRIEDMILVTKTGYELLTKSPKKMLVLPF